MNFDMERCQKNHIKWCDIRNEKPTIKEGKLIKKMSTLSAAFCINCLAEFRHIAGTVMTHRISDCVISPISLPDSLFNRWSFRNLIDFAKTSIAGIVLFWSSLSVISNRNL